MIFDEAVNAHLYKRGSTFVLPLTFFQQAAARCGGELVLKEGDWDQVLFLCSDAVAVSFWVQRPGGPPAHTLASIDVEGVVANAPELIDLWHLWCQKHIDETWDEVRAQLTGNTNVTEYARAIARAYPQCTVVRSVGNN